MYSSVLLHQGMMESPYLRLDNVLWKVVREDALAGILSNC